MPSDLSVDLLDGFKTLELLGNLGLSVVFALVLSYVIERHSRIIGERSQYTVVLLALMPTMVLVITVVRSSLALSLGLVGALSIVRFRTPIKEPEELVYLFLAIAAGLGLGANQVVPTTVAFALVVAVLVAADLLHGRRTTRAVFLDVEGSPDGGQAGVDSLCGILRERKIPFELKRYSEGPEVLSATFVIEAGSTSDLEAVVGDLRQKVAGGSVTIVDRSRQLN
jgi:hypothetical protein